MSRLCVRHSVFWLPHKVVHVAVLALSLCLEDGVWGSWFMAQLTRAGSGLLMLFLGCSGVTMGYNSLIGNMLYSQSV